METNSNKVKKTPADKILPWLIGWGITLVGLACGTTCYITSRIPKEPLLGKCGEVLYFASQQDNKRGLSVGDFRNLEQKFYETDPRHEFAKSYTGGRLQPYIGNPAIKMRGITSWDDPNDRQLSLFQMYDLEEVLYHCTPEELDRVIDAYRQEEGN
jgi:hypothetical protein